MAFVTGYRLECPRAFLSQMFKLTKLSGRCHLLSAILSSHKLPFRRVGGFPFLDVQPTLGLASLKRIVIAVQVG